MKKKILSITIAILYLLPAVLHAQSKLDSLMIKSGLINIHSIDSTIEVSLKYSTTDNFTGINLYGGSLNTAYFQPNFAKMVAKAQRLLKERYPEYSLLIYDAARPISVQRRMYDLVRGTKNSIYVADGRLGGRHNYGVAVDLTIVDGRGVALDMGSPFDFFGEASHTGREMEFVRRGIITAKALKNRRLLFGIMTKAGFAGYNKEWWHFQEKNSIKVCRKKYKLLNF